MKEETTFNNSVWFAFLSEISWDDVKENKREEVMQPCKICDTPAELLFERGLEDGRIVETVVYGEDYKRPYYQCPNCDFLFSTGFDDLSPQDFSDRKSVV